MYKVSMLEMPPPNYHIGIQYVHERRQASCEPVLVRGKRLNGVRLTGLLSLGNLLGKKLPLGKRKILSR